MPQPVVRTLQYMKELFQDSLLTGVPQIVQTRSISRKIIKSLVFLGCMIGFIYQTSEFMKIFYSYPTVLDLDVEYPEEIESPAITFCNLNGWLSVTYGYKYVNPEPILDFHTSVAENLYGRGEVSFQHEFCVNVCVKRIPFCEKFPNECQRPGNLTAFCEAFPVVCKRENPELLKFPIRDALRFEGSANAEEMKTFGHSIGDMLQHCRQLKLGISEYVDCSWDGLLNVTMPDGNTGNRNCYSLFSNVNSSVLDRHRLPVPKQKNPLFHMAFDLEPEQYFRPDRQVGGILSIHSPNSIINPFYNGFVIQPGRLYTVHLKVVEEKLLPDPYETQCKDYEAIWKLRGNKGPLSQMTCLTECIINASLSQCNCVVPEINFPHNERICNEDELDCLELNMTECYHVCPQPCDFTDFEYDVQERILEDESAYSIEDFYEQQKINQKRAVVLVFLKRPEIVVYSHRPQYEDIEIFSFLGGYVGMWLGISLIAVFDFFESVTLILNHWIRRRVAK